MLANHFSNLKFIQAFNKRNEDLELYLFKDRFSLKNFTQEFNVIRHIRKDPKEMKSSKRKNFYRLSKKLDDSDFTPQKLDRFVTRMEHAGIYNAHAVSLTSKIFFLGNPNEIFIYDSFVKEAIQYTGDSYSPVGASISFTQQGLSASVRLCSN